MNSLRKIAIDSLIRPKRYQYDESSLKHTYNLDYYGIVERIPTEFRNKRNQKIIGSLYKTQKYARGHPCIIYLHGNSASQLEGRFLVQLFVPVGISVFCFDFSGSGDSDGEYVSLGFHEKDDLSAAIEFLRTNYKIHKIALWGRSMGAATAIFGLAEHPEISAAVLDSPFAVLKDVIFSIASHYHVGLFLTDSTMEAMDKAANELAHFHIDDVNPIDHITDCYSPVFIIHASQDYTIPMEQSKHIFDEYKTDLKVYRIIDGDHYSKRPPEVLKEATKFVCETLGLTISFDEN